MHIYQVVKLCGTGTYSSYSQPAAILVTIAFQLDDTYGQEATAEKVMYWT
jgi:hypothetical protein